MTICKTIEIDIRCALKDVARAYTYGALTAQAPYFGDARCAYYVDCKDNTRRVCAVGAAFNREEQDLLRERGAVDSASVGTLLRGRSYAMREDIGVQLKITGPTSCWDTPHLSQRKIEEMVQRLQIEHDNWANAVLFKGKHGIGGDTLCREAEQEFIRTVNLCAKDLGIEQVWG